MISTTKISESGASLGENVFAGRKVHLIGVGGCGMYGAARVLQSCGAIVSGSDQKTFAGVGQLVDQGGVIYVGHESEHVSPDTHLVVRSAAVPDDNPEVVAAIQQGVPVIKYAELLGRLMSVRKGVSLAGTHGKSTTSGLTAHVFREAGLDPSFIIGADCPQVGGSSGVGRGAHFIVESCEYARSFLNLWPHSAAILNIEADHLDCYADLEAIEDAFRAFAKQVSPSGLLALNGDDPCSAQLRDYTSARVETFGTTPGVDWRAVNLRAYRGMFRFHLQYKGENLGRFALRIAGRHNVNNALATVALAHEAGASLDAISNGLATYEGVRRRMTLRGKRQGVTVVDDYAHHPTEITATLRAIRSHYRPRRTWVVFQPHQASRTRMLMDQFSQAFTDADFVLIPDIYCVRDSEEDRRAVGAAGLVERLCRNGKQSRYLPTLEEVHAYLLANTTDGDLVVTMGAGDVWKVADAFVECNA